MVSLASHCSSASATSFLFGLSFLAWPLVAPQFLPLVLAFGWHSSVFAVSSALRHGNPVSFSPAKPNLPLLRGFQAGRLPYQHSEHSYTSNLHHLAPTGLVSQRVEHHTRLRRCGFNSHTHIGSSSID